MMTSSIKTFEVLPPITWASSKMFFKHSSSFEVSTNVSHFIFFAFVNHGLIAFFAIAHKFWTPLKFPSYLQSISKYCGIGHSHFR